MKVLFLDIDGVLNKYNTPASFFDDAGRWLRGLDSRLVQRYLHWRASHPTVDTILSSSWREDTKCKELLRDSGVYWSSTTMYTGQSIPRGWEISHWLNANPKVTKVAILDDFNGREMKPVGRYHVEVPEHSGLQDKHLNVVNRLLDL